LSCSFCTFAVFWSLFLSRLLLGDNSWSARMFVTWWGVLPRALSRVLSGHQTVTQRASCRCRRQPVLLAPWLRASYVTDSANTCALSISDCTVLFTCCLGRPGPGAVAVVVWSTARPLGMAQSSCHRLPQPAFQWITSLRTSAFSGAVVDQYRLRLLGSTPERWA